MNSYLLNDILECSVCFKPLDEHNKVLPCQHTFCKTCLTTIVRTQKELRCPECRVVVKQKVEDLPSNILLIRLLDGIKFQQTQFKQHSDKHARRHSVEGILSEPTPASGGAKDGGVVKHTRTSSALADAQNSARTQSEPQVTTRPYALAQYTYQSDQTSDLSFVKGDKVWLLKKIDDNWMSGECHGRNGVFPVNYVKVVHPLPTERPICIAQFDFESSRENGDRDCLTFSKGEKLLAIRRVDENWAEGMFKDKIGIFPLSFVKPNDEARKLLDIMAPLAQDESSSTHPVSHKSTGAGPSARRIINNKQGPKYAKKRHSFPTFHAAKSKESEPTTSHRHSMEILDSDSSSQSGVSPLNPPAPPTPGFPSQVHRNRPVEILVPPTADSLQIPLTSAQNTSPNILNSSNRRDVPQTLSHVVERSKSADITTTRAPTTSTSQRLAAFTIVKATYSYQASKPDELELVKGDTYQITECCNDGWCRGRHLKSGRVGVFPGNYVALAAAATRGSPLTPRDASSSSISSTSSSSSSSPSQPPRSTVKAAERFKPASLSQAPTNPQRLPHVSSSSRTPPPRPVAPQRKVAPHSSRSSSSSGARTSSSTSRPTNEGNPLTAKLHIPGSKSGGISSRAKSGEKDKRKDRGQLLLKMISGAAGKKSKSPPTPTSPTVRSANENPLNHNTPSTSQSIPAIKPLVRDNYRATMNFPANEPDELELKHGDVVVVHHRRPDGWFRGTHMKNGKSGHFPSTFVERVQGD